MRARTTSGTIAVERGETFNYSGMETINWTIPLKFTCKYINQIPNEYSVQMELQRWKSR